MSEEQQRHQQQEQREHLVRLLRACVSPDERARKEAESTVTSSGAHFGFGALLCDTAFGMAEENEAIPNDIRQLAALLLKNTSENDGKSGNKTLWKGNR